MNIFHLLKCKVRIHRTWGNPFLLRKCAGITAQVLGCQFLTAQESLATPLLFMAQAGLYHYKDTLVSLGGHQTREGWCNIPCTDRQEEWMGWEMEATGTRQDEKTISEWRGAKRRRFWVWLPSCRWLMPPIIWSCGRTFLRGGLFL